MTNYKAIYLSKLNYQVCLETISLKIARIRKDFNTTNLPPVRLF